MANPNALNTISLGDRFRVGLSLARTPYGEMYSAEAPDGERAFAFVLSPRFAENPVFKERFFSEAIRSNDFSERGLTRALSHGTSNGFAYVLYEALSGEFVEARRRKQLGRISVLDVYPIAEQFLDIVVALHSRNVFHGDLRPQHLFLESRGTLRVFNAGLGLLSHQAVTSASPGEFFVFPDYLANLAPSVATDIWGIGATLFQLLSGVAPARGALGFRSLLDVAQHVPRPLAEVIDRALHVKPDARWLTASAMRDALEDARSPQTAHDGGFIAMPGKISEPPNPFDNAMETETVTNVVEDSRIALGQDAEGDETEVITGLAGGVPTKRGIEEITLTAATQRNKAVLNSPLPTIEPATDEHLAFDDASTAITESATESLVTEDAVILADALDKGNSTTLTRPEHFPVHPSHPVPVRAKTLQSAQNDPRLAPALEKRAPMVTFDLPPPPAPLPTPPPPPAPPAPVSPRGEIAYAASPAQAGAGYAAPTTRAPSTKAILKRWLPLLAFCAGIVVIWTAALLLFKAAFFE